MIVDGPQSSHAAIGHVRPILSCDFIVLLGHLRRVEAMRETPITIGLLDESSWSGVLSETAAKSSS